MLLGVIGVLLYAYTAEAEPIVYQAQDITVVHIEETLHPTLQKICTCESGQGTGKPQQLNVRTGEVLHGVVNSNDIGMCQINLTYHKAPAQKLGFDLFTEQGNIKYANTLYKKEGSKPWNASRKCWQKP